MGQFRHRRHMSALLSGVALAAIPNFAAAADADAGSQIEELIVTKTF